MKKKISQSRNVKVAFYTGPDKRLNIPCRGSVLQHVYAQLPAELHNEVIGVKDASNNNWID